jgi:hypothetical protein
VWGHWVEGVNIIRSGEKGPVETRFDQIIGNSPASEFVLSEVDTLCLIVDVKMPGISGSELQSHLAAKYCSIRYRQDKFDPRRC